MSHELFLHTIFSFYRNIVCKNIVCDVGLNVIKSGFLSIVRVWHPIFINKATFHLLKNLIRQGQSYKILDAD